MNTSRLCLMCAGMLLVAAASCDDESTSPGGEGGSAGGTTQTGGAGGFVGPAINVHIFAHDAVSTLPIAEVEICVLDFGIDCVMTDAEGNATVAVPATTPMWASLTKKGYVGALFGAVSSDEDMELQAPLISASLATLVANSGNVELDETKAQLGLVAVGYPPDGGPVYPPRSRVTFDLEPKSGSGPHYLNELNFVDPTLTETGDAGGGIWFNVDPDGQYTLVARHPYLPCYPYFAIPTGAPDAYALRVMPGFVTYTTIVCGYESNTGGGGTGAGAAGAAGGSGGSGGAGGSGGSGGAGGSGGSGGSGGT